MSDRPNTPLPDQLAALREQIKSLEEQEAAIRGQLLAHPELRTGAEWIAEIKTVQQSRTDWKELRANHPEVVEEFTFPTEVTRVVLSGITDDGEIISARAKRAQETTQ